jgi:2-dehydro-3-deoxyphosphogluconate aldolase/(4S)-4-hydroxy-2-oxoglutarate aldolase
VNNNKFSLPKFSTLPVIGIIRGLQLDDIKEVLPIYIKAGFTTIEFTMNTPNASEIIQYAVEKYGALLNVGAGTVCDEKTLEMALEAGAQFIVMPIVNETVIKSCVQQKIPVFPGAYTATEIFNAWSLGAEMVKVFPATSLGPDYFKDIRGPLNQIKLVPVGGINSDNCVDFMRAGASGIGVGSQLFNTKMILEKDWEGLLTHFELFANKMMPFAKQKSIS